MRNAELGRWCGWVLLLCAIAVVLAQESSAPPGYYPEAYNGARFTGIVTAADHDTITLTFSADGKTESFTGRFEAVCTVPNGTKEGKPMHANNIPSGSRITAYYYPRKVKVDGKKEKENAIIAISIARWKDHEFPPKMQGLIACSDSKFSEFRAFNQ